MDSNVSPCSANNAEEARIRRENRYRLRDASRRVLPREQVARCGRYLLNLNRRKDGGQVTIKANAKGASLFGLVTCGSIWHCPVCAAKIAEGRRGDVSRVLDGHYGAGGVAYMAAFTVPHTAFQRCVDLKTAVAGAWRKVQGGKQWQVQKARAGLVGTVRALEVTHGDNGWHPHLHVLFFLRRDDPEVAAVFGRWLFERWSRIIARVGLGKCTPEVWRFEKARCPAQAGDYVAKWGAAGEMVYGARKGGNTAGRSPWQILADICEYGMADDVALFAEYGAAFKGARQLTWSCGLRELYADDPDATDAELAEAEDVRARPVAYLCERGFEEIRDRGLVTVLLDFVERDGWRGVVAFSAAYRVGLCYFRRADCSQVPYRDRQIEARV